MRLLLLFLLPTLALAAPPADAGRLLTGADTTLAALVADGPTLVLLSFERDQTDDLVAAYAPLDAFAADTGVAWAVAPVLPRSIRALRRLIDGGIAKKISEPHKARTASFYVDKEPFLAALGIADEGQLALLLFVDGEVTWRGAGPPTDASLSSLRAALPPKATP